MLFGIESNKLKEIIERGVELEKDLQKLTEENLYAVFGFEFICREYQLNGLRIDTLAYNAEINGFVIIEYKKDRNLSVIDQGYSYLSLLLNNKADFVLEYNKRTKSNRQKEDFDWSQTKVIFLASSFTNYQLNAINFRDLPIELWEVKQFKNHTISYEKIISSNARDSIKTVTKNSEITKVQQEVKNYTVDGLFGKDWVNSRVLYDQIKEKIIDLDSAIEVIPTKYYVSFKIGSRNLVTIHPQKQLLRVDFIRIKPDDIKDPEKALKYWARSLEQYNVNISSASIKSASDLSYILYLVQQLHGKFFG